MNETKGGIFISYKRERAEAANLFANYLKERGVPVWQDVSDLPPGVTESELRNAINGCSGALLLITPEVARSTTIREIELPAIFNRYDSDNFFVLPVASNDLDYSEIAHVLGSRVGLTNIAGLNWLRCPTTDFGSDFIRHVAVTALHERLKRLRASLSVSIEFVTRQPPLDQGVSDLKIDLRHLFRGRLAPSAAWNERILPALSDVANGLANQIGPSSIVASGFAGLPAMVALGAAFLSTKGLRLSWRQQQADFGHEPEVWNLFTEPEPCGFTTRSVPQSAGGTDYALLLSINSNVVDDFKRCSSGLPLRAIVEVSRGESAAVLPLNAGRARDVVDISIAKLRSAWSEYGARGTIHVFVAAPAGVAMMIGQRLNTFGSVQTYEHVAGEDPCYKPAARLAPSA